MALSAVVIAVPLFVWKDCKKSNQRTLNSRTQAPCYGKSTGQNPKIFFVNSGKGTSTQRMQRPFLVPCRGQPVTTLRLALEGIRV